ncbi:MAG TPA: lasso peptide biosynthesis B2 protein [Oscillatoriales cyanobacterium M59_W2019_021]|nr:MAG: lasso peptide biosynthesis B2 protein [Cyanobacteria bacterium J055]HIK30438.1 lasso peptide biosynthesis B2 protein [Oscillatoriales cyanobacterium M4454_W2019_049]HIK51077.1 lasso peptide biosynthesis B2 protein [Oscillatoriales cyanobacterium M59_W2019_021]
MKKWLKFWKLSSANRARIVLSILSLGAIKLGLKFLPFRILKKSISGVYFPVLKQKPSSSIGEIIWAIDRVSPYLKVKCLARALAADFLLRHQGYSTQLRIGVAKDENGTLTAHAWLESEGQIAIGRVPNLSNYTALPNLKI